MFHRTSNYFIQNIRSDDIKSRHALFYNTILGKSCLHVGCADFPIYNESINLHKWLITVNPTIVGYDPDVDTIQKMKESPIFKDSTLVSSLPDETYDVILMPEVIEHLINPGQILEDIYLCLKIGGNMLITAPNAFHPDHYNPAKYVDKNTYQEFIHPDHKFWFSVYTLTNLISEVFKDRIKILQCGTIEDKHMVYTLFTKLSQ